MGVPPRPVLLRDRRGHLCESGAGCYRTPPSCVRPATFISLAAAEEHVLRNTSTLGMPATAVLPRFIGKLVLPILHVWLLLLLLLLLRNRYYNEIISTHPSVALSDDGDTEDVDELALGMIEAAQVTPSSEQPLPRRPRFCARGAWHRLRMRPSLAVGGLLGGENGRPCGLGVNSHARVRVSRPVPRRADPSSPEA